VKLYNKQIKVELQATFGSDRDIANAAWTSSSLLQEKSRKTDKDVQRVIDMLADQRHSTPFESVIFRFWIKVPIAIDRQIMTHRIMSSSGLSGRYRTMPSEYLDVSEDVQTILEKLRGKTTVEILNKENNVITKIHGNEDLLAEYYSICESANHSYKFLTALAKDAKLEGIISNDEYKRVREFYRGILPQHNMTERVIIMNLRSWSNFQRLRNSPHAQPEIQEVAIQMLNLIEKSNTCPIALNALKRNNWHI